jgi:hypothetical protein
MGLQVKQTFTNDATAKAHQFDCIDLAGALTDSSERLQSIDGLFNPDISLPHEARLLKSAPTLRVPSCGRL